MMYASVNGAQRAIGLYAGVDGAVRRLDQDTSDATATAADIAQGKTAYTAAGKVTGVANILKIAGRIAKEYSCTDYIVPEDCFAFTDGNGKYICFPSSMIAFKGDPDGEAYNIVCDLNTPDYIDRIELNSSTVYCPRNRTIIKSKFMTKFLY